MDGKIAYTSNSLLHVLDMADRSVTPVANTVHAAFPDWHPSGERIALGTSKILIYDLNTQQVTSTTQDTLVASYPAWHPSGNMLAFDVKQRNEDGLYFQEFETNVEFGVDLPFPVFQADWHPNGREIVFVGIVNNQKHIFKLDMSCVTSRDCADKVQQLTRTGKFNHAPAWSPDGQHIAFETYLDTEKRWVIMVMDADGSNPRRLSGPDANDHHPTWGPEGWIAFQRQTEQGNRLFMMRADGSEVTQLTETEAVEPDWWYPH
ncbi:MAG: hypothetical protein OHK0023_19300 [Anaerolineae bacterium]